MYILKVPWPTVLHGHGERAKRSVGSCFKFFRKLLEGSSTCFFIERLLFAL